MWYRINVIRGSPFRLSSPFFEREGVVENGREELLGKPLEERVKERKDWRRGEMSWRIEEWEVEVAMLWQCCGERDGETWWETEC